MESYYRSVEIKLSYNKKIYLSLEKTQRPRSCGSPCRRQNPKVRLLGLAARFCTEIGSQGWSRSRALSGRGLTRQNFDRKKHGLFGQKSTIFLWRLYLACARLPVGTSTRKDVPGHGTDPPWALFESPEVPWLYLVDRPRSCAIWTNGAKKRRDRTTHRHFGAVRASSGVWRAPAD